MLKLLFITFFAVACANVTTLNKVEDMPETETQNTQILTANEQTPKKVITPYITKTNENDDQVKTYCENMELYFKKYNWGPSRCNEYTWHHVRNSHLGHPIVWFVFGKDEPTQSNSTLILCGVHGDEITPVKFCFDVLEDIKNNPEIIGNNQIIIAPLVAPDSFFTNKPTRTNAQGVDVNRNFPTTDWSKNALKLWKSRYKSDKRRFPGKYALSEQETIFQVNLITRYNPKKIISVHAPLTLLDYDGPTFGENTGKAAKKMLIEMSDIAGNYKVSNYPFFTGSLGNWAGNERNIPTYTLELPNSDWNKTDKYYKLFRGAIQHAIEHDLNDDYLKKKVSPKLVQKND